MPATAPRVGVFLCKCGGNISDFVDLEAVRKAAEKMDGVVAVEVDEHWCSSPAAKRMKEVIKERDLNRVVIVACTLNMHQPHFMEVLQEAGLNPYLLERVNAREQCSWVHKDHPAEATQKAIELVRGGVARAKHLAELTPIVEKINRNVVVVGGGVAGIIASLELAYGGYRVFLVEKSPTIGGRMAKFSKVFPSLDCASCILTPRMAEVESHKNITLLTHSELLEVSGSAGNFKVKILKKPRYVDPALCTGCRECMAVCPVKVPNEWNVGLDKRPAIYIPFPEAVPRVATVDEANCLYLKYSKPGKPVCGKCVEVCKARAINWDQKPEVLEVEAGAILLAVGSEVFDARKVPQLGYGLYRNVITSMEFERMINSDGPTGGKVVNPVTGEVPRVVAFIQCVGSRDEKYNPYCCRIGCTATLKHAVLLKEYVSKDIDVYVCYNDMRTVGKGFEEFYRRVRDLGVKFIRGLPSEVKQKPDGTLSFNVFDTTTETLYEVNADLVVLAIGLVPSPDIEKMAKLLKLSRGHDGFLLEAHEKLRPVETLSDGIFVAGSCLGPMDIHDATAEAMAAASKIMGFLSAGEIVKEPIVARVNEDLCSGCRVCVSVCPFDAIKMEEKGEGKFVARVEEVLCKGCGLCASSCPTAAITTQHFTDEQIRAQVKGILVGA